MGKPYSMDLRERVVASVERDGLSRRQAAVRFEVGISTVIRWVSRLRETSSLAPGKMGGHTEEHCRRASGVAVAALPGR
jgi:putative transposase